MAASTAAQLHPRREWLILAIILLAAAVVRLWGIDFGFPGKYRPDEEYLVSRAVRMLSGDLNPHFFAYPTLFIYLLAGVLQFCKMIAALTGVFWPLTFEQYLQLHAKVPAYLAGRLLCCGFGVATVGATYFLGRRAYGRTAGYTSAAVLALCFLHVRDSKYATTDVTMTFFLTLTLWLLLRVAERGTWRDYLLASLFAGMAMSTKYTAAFVSVSFAAASLWHLFSHRSARSFAEAAAKPLVAALCAVAVFLLCSPYIVIDWVHVSSALMEHWRASGEGQCFDGSFGWRWLIFQGLHYGAGWGLTALTAVAFVEALRAGLRTRPPRAADIIFFCYLGTLLGILAVSKLDFMRYLLPVMPVMAVLGGGVIVRLTEFSKLAIPRVPLMGVLLMAVIAQPFSAIIGVNRLFATEDTRELLRAWLAANVSPHSRIAIFNHWKYSRPTNLPHDIAWVKAGHELRPLECRKAAIRRWVLVEEHPEHFYVHGPSADQQQYIERYGTLVLELNPFRANGVVPVFDSADAFWIPIAGFEGLARPGPILKMYRLNCEEEHTEEAGVSNPR